MGIGYIFAQKFDFCSAGTDVVKKYMDIISIHGISVFFRFRNNSSAERARQSKAASRA